MYELFVLGELMDQPLHGYLLHEIINKAFGPARQMSWGALYPLIRRLEADGYIEQEAASTGSGGRQRKVYRITEAGCRRFHSLMLEPDEYNTAFPDLFNVKMCNFDHIPSEQQLAILQRYRGYIAYVLDYLETRKGYISHHPSIPERERPHILRVISHHLHLHTADLAWIDGEIATTLAQGGHPD